MAWVGLTRILFGGLSVRRGVRRIVRRVKITKAGFFDFGLVDIFKVELIALVIHYSSS